MPLFVSRQDEAVPVEPVRRLEPDDGARAEAFAASRRRWGGGTTPSGRQARPRPTCRPVRAPRGCLRPGGPRASRRRREGRRPAGQRLRRRTGSSCRRMRGLRPTSSRATPARSPSQHPAAGRACPALAFLAASSTLPSPEMSYRNSATGVAGHEPLLAREGDGPQGGQIARARTRRGEPDLAAIRGPCDAAQPRPSLRQDGAGAGSVEQQDVPPSRGEPCRQRDPVPLRRYADAADPGIRFVELLPDGELDRRTSTVPGASRRRSRSRPVAQSASRTRSSSSRGAPPASGARARVRVLSRISAISPEREIETTLDCFDPEQARFVASLTRGEELVRAGPPRPRRTRSSGHRERNAHR